MHKRYCTIAVNAPLGDGRLTYSFEGDLSRGLLVEVPLGRRKEKGIVLAIDIDESSIPAEWINKIRPITQILSEEITLQEDELKLFEWMSQYYHYPIGQLIWDALPKLLKRPRKLEVIHGDGRADAFELSSEQQSVTNDLLEKMNSSFSKSYLHGVTGSGKTVVYIEMMKKILKQGRSVLFLVPEINLTPQFLKTFGDHLNVPIYSYHSAVTASEKFSIWKNLNSHEGPFILMGVRSSVFVPMNNLGLIIVDEEHDSSFKQTDRCPYNARDIAIKKAQLLSIPVVLGSATPSLENFYQFHQSNDYYQLPNRVTGEFPAIITIDDRGEHAENQYWPIHPKSIAAIEDALTQNEQVLVFINKLGFASYIQCRACGHQFQNEACGCGLNLRYFKRKEMLSCSHCEFSMPKPDSCPKCGNINLLQKGFGTERVAQVLSEIFQDKRVERFDRDEIKNFSQLNERLDEFNAGKIDILVGTQMLSKGHNFKKVNLVVILGIDSQLNFADFRANERTYQLVSQVAGRSGRFSQHGKVLIQTMNPNNPVFNYLRTNSFDGFYLEELEHREISETPPFTRQVVMNFSGKDRNALVSSIDEFAQKLRSVITDHFDQVQLFGPIPSWIEKRAEQFTWFLLIKSNNISQLHSLLSTIEKNINTGHKISVKIDVDPYLTC